jgi:hypothetical protein
MMKTVFIHTPLLKGESRAYVSLFLSGIRVYVYIRKYVNCCRAASNGTCPGSFLCTYTSFASQGRSESKEAHSFFSRQSLTHSTQHFSFPLSLFLLHGPAVSLKIRLMARRPIFFFAPLRAHVNTLHAAPRKSLDGSI